ncbi:hypothetical protein [Leptolyngbya sp. FACHB-261]|uniref:hypothetical protein n=1 Tax=Leptolyngbya sp. FACHB-261 TaxID=2692806 RepID=UPI001685C218|nr:hypothetical protein [Leptolyngbya sp. FACHB-261]MBD2102644.1 hypothetical protein [Leptolyngbya sp. FACHB-261]
MSIRSYARLLTLAVATTVIGLSAGIAQAGDVDGSSQSATAVQSSNQSQYTEGYGNTQTGVNVQNVLQQQQGVNVGRNRGPRVNTQNSTAVQLNQQAQEAIGEGNVQTSVNQATVVQNQQQIRANRRGHRRINH